MTRTILPVVTFAAGILLTASLNVAVVAAEPSGCATVKGCATMLGMDAYRLHDDETPDRVSECLRVAGYSGHPNDGVAVIYAPWREIERCAGGDER